MSEEASAPTLDPTVAKVLDRKRPDEDDEDVLLAELEAEDSALDGFRERRLQQLHEEFARARQMKNTGSGGYDEMHDEKTVMDITTSSKHALIHFFHPDFRRCKIMSLHLGTLAPKHPEARFVRISVEKAPFLVERLGVKVLPCVMAFTDGKSCGRIEGFERMGNTDGFRTVRLEEVLVEFGVLERIRMEEGGSRIQGREEEVDDDSDWDD